MSAAPEGIFVACTPSAVYFRVIGQGASRNSVSLRECATGQFNRGYRQFYVDLRACQSMDSTFLGVFAGLGMRLDAQGKLTLLGLAGDQRRAFLDLGFEEIAAVEAPAPEMTLPELPPEHAFELLPGSSATARQRQDDLVDRALLMLEAHECLCRMNERNEAKFKEVKQFLRQDIARRTHPEPPES